MQLLQVTCSAHIIALADDNCNDFSEYAPKLNPPPLIVIFERVTWIDYIGQTFVVVKGSMWTTGIVSDWVHLCSP